MIDAMVVRGSPSYSSSPMRLRILRRLSFIVPLALFCSGAIADTAGMKPAGGAKPATSASASAGLKINTPPPPTGPLYDGLDALEKSDYAAADKTLKAITGKDAAKATIGLARVAFETGKDEEA